jgi:cell division septation protein DedD
VLTAFTILHSAFCISQGREGVMSEEPAIDEQSQSHYEISLTAGQAFVAFVLLLLSLAATFAFGLMIGKGQADERLVVRKEPAVINEASALPKKGDGKIVELGVSSDDFKSTTTTTTATAAPTTTAAAVAPSITEGTTAATETAAPAVQQPKPAAAPPPAAPAPSGPVEAQLASILDQKGAETLAAKLINKGFTSAYVQRGANDKGTIWRVRVKFPSEAEATAAMPRLREFSKDIWITR